MQDFKQLLSKKKMAQPKGIDEKSIFYVFQLVIKEEYGRQGSENIKPLFFQDRKLFIKVLNSVWASEILQSRAQIVKRVNAQLGGDEIVDLSMAQ